MKRRGSKRALFRLMRDFYICEMNSQSEARASTLKCGGEGACGRMHQIGSLSIGFGLLGVRLWASERVERVDELV